MTFTDLIDKLNHIEQENQKKSWKNLKYETIKRKQVPEKEVPKLYESLDHHDNLIKNRIKTLFE